MRHSSMSSDSGTYHWRRYGRRVAALGNGLRRYHWTDPIMVIVFAALSVFASPGDGPNDSDRDRMTVLCCSPIDRGRGRIAGGQRGNRLHVGPGLRSAPARRGHHRCPGRRRPPARRQAWGEDVRTHGSARGGRRRIGGGCVSHGPAAGVSRRRHPRGGGVADLQTGDIRAGDVGRVGRAGRRHRSDRSDAIPPGHSAQVLC